MDFEKDLAEIAKETLESYNITCDDLKNDYDIIWRWINFESKLISPQIREVFLSEEIRVSPFLTTYKIILDEITRKFKAGENVNKYLSKTIFKKDFTDCLFSDWGVYHLHLGEDDLTNYFVKRTDHLLFLAIDNNKAYFIDILPHNADYVFDQKKILETLCKNWPDALAKYKIKGVIDIHPIIDTPQEIHDMRKAGISVIQKIGDGIYAPRGGGLTSAGTGINITISTDRLLKEVRATQSNFEKNLSIISEKLKIPIEDISLKLILYKNNLHVIEKKSKTIFQ